MLRARGLLGEDDSEEIVIVRGERIRDAMPVTPTAQQLLAVGQGDEPGH